MTPLKSTIALVLTAIAASALAQERSVRLDDAYGDAFVNYLPYHHPVQKKEKPTTQPAPSQAQKPAIAVEKKDDQTVDVEWLQKNYPLLEKRAIDDPSPQNIQALAYTKRMILDKAQRFENAMMETVRQDPLLNENNRVPYASAGAQAVVNADYLAQQQAVRELATIGGMLVFVDGSCRFCAMQLPVMNMLRTNYGMESLVISLDGSRPKGYEGRLLKDNGFFKKLDLKLTPSIVFVPSPKAFEGEADPNQYLVISQGFYTADELSKQIAFAGHKTKLLTKQTMKDLEVWDRGVASTEDLKNIRLDPNKPETFKKTLQPLLLKQYQ